MSGFNINNFLAEIKRSGVAYPTRYSIFFSQTSSGKIIFQREDIEKMNLRLTKVNMPGMNLASKGQNLAGLNREIPYGRTFEGTIDLEFVEDSSLSIRTFFENWQSLIVNKDTLKVGYYKDYVCENMKITVEGQTTADYSLDSTGNYSITAYEVWPKTISSVDLDSTSDDIIKTTINLSYRKWVSSYAKSKKRPLPNNTNTLSGGPVDIGNLDFLA